MILAQVGARIIDLAGALLPGRRAKERRGVAERLEQLDASWRKKPRQRLFASKQPDIQR